MRSRSASFADPLRGAHFVSKECWIGLVSAFQSLWAAMNFSVRGMKCPPSVKMRIAGDSSKLVAFLRRLKTPTRKSLKIHRSRESLSLLLIIAFPLILH